MLSLAVTEPFSGVNDGLWENLHLFRTSVEGTDSVLGAIYDDLVVDKTRESKTSPGQMHAVSTN